REASEEGRGLELGATWRRARRPAIPQVPQPFPPRRRRESGLFASRGGQPEGPLPERAGTMRSAKGAPPRREARGNAHPLSGRRQARADLSDDRRLAEPRQETPTSPRARQALTR